MFNFKEFEEKYLAADEQGKKVLLEERRQQRKIEEQQREKQINDERKERFVSKANKQIKIYKDLQRTRKVALEVIKSFDGKVLNNRLTKAVTAELKKLDNSFYAHLDIEYDRQQQNNVGRLKLSANEYHFEDQIILQIVLSPLSDSNRVKYDATESLDKNSCEYIDTRIAEWKQACKEYEKVLKQAQKIEADIRKYGEKANFHLRNFFQGESIIHSKWYL